MFKNKSKEIKDVISNLQINDYLNAQDIINNAFEHYYDFLTNSNFSLNENNHNDLINIDDFSIWQSGIVECYKNRDKWHEVFDLSENLNDLNMEIESLWNYGKEEWPKLDQLVNKYKKSQYPSQINQIYMMMKSNNNNEENNKYQQKCMSCIRTIYQDFTNFPPNLEKLDYYYFLVFQLIVEAWESTNTLKETEKNIIEGKLSDFRENLVMWRDRLPYVCEGFQALKNIIEPRNFLFDYLKELIKKKFPQRDDQANNLYPNVNDKIWNDMMFIKYARKLNLKEVFFKYLFIFNEEHKEAKITSPFVNYLKNLEELKYIKQHSYNFEKGIIICENLIIQTKNENIIINNNSNNNNNNANNEIKDINNFLLASYYSYQAYFTYKEGEIIKANNLFKTAVSYNSIDYHIYLEWANMCEEIMYTIKGEKVEEIWFENTILNYLTTIIYKLDKAKFIIPKILFIINEFKHINLNNFDVQINNIAPWVWLFFLSNIFQLFIDSIGTNRNEFFFNIIKKISGDYIQPVFYNLNIFRKDSDKKELINKYEEIFQIISEKDKLNHIISKIKKMISEIINKTDRNSYEVVLSTLEAFELSQQIEQRAMQIINFYANYLLKTQQKGIIFNIANNLLQLSKKKSSIFDIVNKTKNIKYFLHSKIATENTYQELSNIFNNSLYNMNLDGVEIPGIYSNKITEPNDENNIKISRIDSEYSKSYTFLNKRLLIRGTNDKIYNFTLEKENYFNSSEIKFLQMQTLLNYTFAKDKIAYQLKVKFNVLIKYFLNNVYKIVQEEINQYYMNNVYEFCLQKNGYDPEICFNLYEEEAKKTSNKNIFSYFDTEIKQKVFNKMVKIIPPNTFKCFIHKFLIASDDIFIFQKQFATSYALNSLFVYFFGNYLTLHKISFNKDNGSCTFHDPKYELTDGGFKKEINKNTEQISIRLSKNISYFLSIPALYGIIPSVMHATANAMFNKFDLVKKIMFNFVFLVKGENIINLNESIELANAFMNKVVYVRNIRDDDDNRNPEDEINNINNNMDIDDNNNNINNNFINVSNKNNNNPLEKIFIIIESSLNEENLKKTNLAWDPWF